MVVFDRRPPRSARHRVAAALLGLGALWALPGDGAWGGDPTAVEAEQFAAGSVVTHGINRFGVSVFDALAAASPDETVLVSPYSLGVALAMTGMGARGGSAEALAAALATDDLTAADIAAAHGWLARALATQDDPDLVLRIANGLWYDAGTDVRPDFLATLRDDFAAAAEPTDFDDADAVPRINRWVGERTEGLIDDLLDGLPPMTRLVLVNALYFKGLWSVPFDPAETVAAPFARPGGEGPATVPMMRRSDSLAYADGNGFSGVRLGFGEGGAELILALPDESAEEGAAASGAAFGAWLAEADFRSRPGTVSLPRLDLDWSAGLTDVLSDLGLAPLFRFDQADLSGMAGAPGDLKIDSVLQKTVLTLDEEGAEAAAATAVIVTTRMMPTEDPFDLAFDRPFYLALRHGETGALLFLGRVADPGTRWPG